MSPDPATLRAAAERLRETRYERSEHGLEEQAMDMTIPPDTKRSLSQLVAAAFRPTTDWEKDALVKDAGEKLARDQEQGQ